MNKTKIIAIEGIDGGGKGVQTRLLAQNLKNMGYTVALRDYPIYTSFFGEQIGRFLSAAEGTRADEIDGKSMALWFALDRWASFKDYKDGEADYLVINRYVLSNAVYQSIRDIDIGRADIVEWVMELEYNRFNLPRPDINLVFSVLPAAAGRNVAKKGFRDYVGGGKDVYEQSSGIQQRAMAKYIELAERFDDCAIINCMGEDGLLTIEKIGEKVLDTLKNKGIV